MPKILEIDGYKFFFYSNEGEPLEKCHIHVRKHIKVAKYWLDPEVSIASNYGMTSKELNTIEKMIEDNQELIRRKWHEYFN